MSDIDRKSFLKEKLNNFILFIKKTFGDQNTLLREFSQYVDIEKHGFDPFLKGLLTICEYLELPMDTEQKKANNMSKLNTYLAMKDLKCSDDDNFKMLRYFELFYKTF